MTYSVKRGESLILRITARSGGDVVDLRNGYEVASSIRAVVGVVFANMDTEIDNEGKAVIDFDTKPLPPGRYQFDVRFTKDGRDVFTKDFSLWVQSSITRPSER